MVDYQKRQEKLRRIVNNARRDPKTVEFIVRQASGILTHLGFSQDYAEEYVRSMTYNPIADLTEFETSIHCNLRDHSPVYQYLPERMQLRAQAWFDVIRPHLLHANTLDLGGGSGEVAKMVMDDIGCNVTIADPLDYRRYQYISFRPVVGSQIDAGDNEFEQTLVLTVLHHPDDVEQLVSETFRVTSKRVIIIESVTNDLMMYRYGCWIDWFYNHILQFNPDISKKVNVPCNLKSSDEWQRIIWKETGLEPTVSKNLGIFQWLNPENHHLFVYDKV